MEYIQAFLFTSKYIFGRSGNTDIFYLFAGFALCFYAWKRHEKVKLIAVSAVPFLIVCSVMALCYSWTNPVRCGVFFFKMLFNLTIMVFVAYNCKKWKMIKFVETIVWIHALETILAMLLRDSSLWLVESVTTGGTGTISRLQLFYLDPASLSFTSGLVLVLLIYQLLTEEVIWHQVIGVFVMVVDLYFSYGVGAIITALTAIFAMLFMTIFYKSRRGDIKGARNCTLGAVTTMAIAGIAFFSNTLYLERVKGILTGTDSVLYTKVIFPLMNIWTVLTETHFLGVGFGNANTGFALGLMNAQKAYPNSFLRIIAEGGIFGILLVLICIFALGYLCYKYGNIFDATLYLYIILYQMGAGYFTDPTNFFIYGWIVGDCLMNRAEQRGEHSFVKGKPQREKLLIGMIGHKRIPSREGGVEVVVEEVSRRLVQRGHHVDAYNRGGQHVSGEEYNLVDYDHLDEYEGIRIIRIPTIQKKGIAALVYSALASLKAVAGNYDVIHYHAEGPCAFLWLPSLFGVRTVATIHGLDWQRKKWKGLASTFLKIGERVAAGYSDEIIVLSRHLYQYFWDTYHRKTVYIPNGINQPTRKEVHLVKEKWGLEKQEYILFLGRIVPEKGVHYLIEAFGKLNTDKKLVIAGGSSDTDEYGRELRQSAKGDGRIIFTGFVQGEALDELYTNAYIYCLPSDLEGMPISLLEAMSYGCCVLVSDIPECAEVVGNHGVTFLRSDVRNLQEVLQNLIDHPDIVKEYQSKAAAYICNKYQWDTVVDRTIELYRR